MILSADGAIVTNSHVIANACRVRVPAEMPGRPLIEPADKVLDAPIVGLDRDSDLALKVEKTGLSLLSLGDSDLLAKASSSWLSATRWDWKWEWSARSRGRSKPTIR